MANSEFESVRDVRRAVQELRQFASDAVYSRLFEGIAESNLFHPDESRLEDIAATIVPDLKELEKDMLLDFEHHKALGEYSRQISNDAYDRMGTIIFETRHVYKTIGIFIGAKLADPTGRVLDLLSEGLLRAILAQPKHQGLPAKKKHPAPAVFTEEL